MYHSDQVKHNAWGSAKKKKKIVRQKHSAYKCLNLIMREEPQPPSPLVIYLLLDWINFKLLQPLSPPATQKWNNTHTLLLTLHCDKRPPGFMGELKVRLFQVWVEDIFIKLNFTRPLLSWVCLCTIYMCLCHVWTHCVCMCVCTHVFTHVFECVGGGGGGELWQLWFNHHIRCHRSKSNSDNSCLNANKQWIDCYWSVQNENRDD